MNFSTVQEESIDVFLFRRADLRQDFKEVLADLLCIIAVGLADESDGIRQQHMTLCFFRTSPQGSSVHYVPRGIAPKSLYYNSFLFITVSVCMLKYSVN